MKNIHHWRINVWSEYEELEDFWMEMKKSGIHNKISIIGTKFYEDEESEVERKRKKKETGADELMNLISNNVREIYITNKNANLLKDLNKREFYLHKLIINSRCAEKLEYLLKEEEIENYSGLRSPMIDYIILIEEKFFKTNKDIKNILRLFPFSMIQVRNNEYNDKPFSS